MSGHNATANRALHHDSKRSCSDHGLNPLHAYMHPSMPDPAASASPLRDQHRRSGPGVCPHLARTHTRQAHKRAKHCRNASGFRFGWQKARKVTCNFRPAPPHLVCCAAVEQSVGAKLKYLISNTRRWVGAVLNAEWTRHSHSLSLLAVVCA